MCRYDVDDTDGGEMREQATPLAIGTPKQRVA